MSKAIKGVLLGLVLCVVLAGSSLLFVACGSNDNKENDNVEQQIIGVWQIAFVNDIEVQRLIQFVFIQDGIFIEYNVLWGGSNNTSFGSWQLNNDIININLTNSSGFSVLDEIDNTRNINFTFVFDDNESTLTLYSGFSRFVLRRQ